VDLSDTLLQGGQVFQKKGERKKKKRSDQQPGTDDPSLPSKLRQEKKKKGKGKKKGGGKGRIDLFWALDLSVLHLSLSI